MNQKYLYCILSLVSIIFTNNLSYGAIRDESDGAQDRFHLMNQKYSSEFLHQSLEKDMYVEQIIQSEPAAMLDKVNIPQEYLELLFLSEIKQYHNPQKVFQAITDSESNLIIQRYRNYIAKRFNNDFKTAVDKLTLDIQQNPDDIEAYLYRGIAHIELNNIEQAHQDFQKIIELDSTFMDIYIVRGINRFKEGQYELALEDFNKAFQINTESPQLLTYRALTFLWLEDIESAWKDFERVIELDSKIGYVYFCRGSILSWKGQYDDAIIEYNKAEKLSFEVGDLYNERGRVYLQQGKLEEALADLNKAVELLPDSYVVYLNRAYTFYRQGNKNRDTSQFFYPLIR